jgi:hypothetical protein
MPGISNFYEQLLHKIMEENPTAITGKQLVKQLEKLSNNEHWNRP